MRKKLPAKLRTKLKPALALGRFPDDNAASEAAAMAIIDAFAYDLDHNVGSLAPANLRRAAALIRLWSDMQGDGLLVGVAANQPELAAIAAEAAKAFGLASARKQLEKVVACIPPDVLKLDDPGDRLDWYESAAGAKLAAKLEKLEEMISDSDFGYTVMWACLRQAGAHPDEFFAR